MGRHHLKAMTASGLAQVVGVADPAADEDEIRALLPADALVVPSADDLLERAKPDVVHIVTPPGTHASLAAQALRAGSHVYVEKPFTPTKADAAMVLALAAERGLKVCAGHQVLFEAPALAAMDALPEIGRLTHIESYFSFKMVRRSITPAEQVLDILPHAVYPVVEQLRSGAGAVDGNAEISVVGMSLDADGEAYVLLRLGRVTAVVLVTLNGRPVEQYQVIVGTNGSLRPDYIGGGMAKLVGPGTGPGVLLTPYRRAFRTATGTTGGIVRLLRGGSYPGLKTLVRRFYQSVADQTPSPVTPQSILDTVGICEHVGNALMAVERESEERARIELLGREAALPAPDAQRDTVLLTGAGGLLGRRVAEELVGHRLRVRGAVRRIPPYSKRVPGVEYVVCDLSRGVSPSLLSGVTAVVHAAAETAGGKQDHQRNSIDATRLLIEAAASSGVKRFIHISSIAVLKTSREVGKPIDEDVPLDRGTLTRGPYVWGKAESEAIAEQRAAELGVSLKIIRPGPLVDYAAFHPPGRLGREIGPFFVAIGPKQGPLSVCDVSTAARVIRSYLMDFDPAPARLNLVESPPPLRRELLGRYLAIRPDLRAIWVPALLLRVLAPPLKWVQRLALGSTQPIDVAAAFASERYRTDLASHVIHRASAETAAV